MSLDELDNVRFGPDGLIPAIAQDVESGDVLMLAYMNREALDLTRSTGRSHFWSRSRGKLWRKGESSGNEQLVHDILINCEQNSLLLKVHQLGAVCHEGYGTCFFRTLNGDGSLSVVRDRVFDPAEVYGASKSNTTTNSLNNATNLQFGAYLYLRDHDLERESGTSRRLRRSEEDVRPRVADELIELAGVLDGEHHHADFDSDIRLESSQAIYWILLEAIRAGASWERLRPDRALSTAEETPPAATVSGLLRAEALNWHQPVPVSNDAVATAHAALALVGLACRVAGLDPLLAVSADLDDLRSRPYLSEYFRSATR